MINVVIPMAGLGSRFAQAGFEKPKPFIDVNGLPMISRVLENLKIPGARYYLIANRTHMEREFINNDLPLLIANSDQIVDIDINDFWGDCIKRNLDGSILCFKDEQLSPKWSFAKLDDGGLVTEVKEKEPISENATVGIYFFSQGSLFVNSAVDMIINNDRVNNEFYTCPVYNYAINKQKKIGAYFLNQKQMHGIGTPEDLKIYLNK